MALRRNNDTFIPQGPNRGLTALAMANPYDDVMSAVEKMGQRGAVASAEQGATADVMSGNNPGLSLGLTPAGQAYNQAAMKAYETRTSMDIRAKHAELSAQFTGRNANDPKAYAETMDAYVSGVVSAVPEGLRPQIAAEARLRRDTGLAAITEAATQHQFRLSVSEMEMGYKASLEDAAGLAMAGKGDLADAALLQGLGRVDSLVGVGAISAGEGEMWKRNARSEVAAGTLYQGFLAGHVSIDAVESGNVGAELPGDVRERLVRQMQAEQAHRRSEQNHALAVQTKNIAQGDRDLNALTRRFELGILPTQEELARLNGYTTGGLAASPVQIEEARASYRGIGIAREVATATPEQIALIRGQWAANPPTSIEDALVRDKAAEAFDAREKGLKDDPMAYAMAVLPDKFPAVALPTDPSSPEFDGALRQLSENADTMRAQFGVDGLPMTKAQAQQFASTLAMLPADAKAVVRGKVEANMGPNASAVWEALGKEGATVAAHAGILAAQGRADIASSIEQGKQALDLKTVAVPTPAQANPAFFASGIPEAFSYSPQAQAQVKDAALARAAYLATVKGEPDNVAEHLPQAYKDVGGVTGDYNGGKIALPLGMDDLGDFSDRVESVTPEAAASLGWPPGVAEALSSGDARLTSIGEGRYFVTVGATRVLDPAGKPFVLEYGKIPPPKVVSSGGFLGGEPLIRAAVR